MSKLFKSGAERRFVPTHQTFRGVPVMADNYAKAGERTGTTEVGSLLESDVAWLVGAVSSIGYGNAGVIVTVHGGRISRIEHLQTKKYLNDQSTAAMRGVE